MQVVNVSFKYQTTSQTSNDWVTRDYTSNFADCDECQGITTTLAPTTTAAPTTTVAPTTLPPIFYKIYTQCNEGAGAVKYVSNQSNTFPNVIYDGTLCYELSTSWRNRLAKMEMLTLIHLFQIVLLVLEQRLQLLRQLQLQHLVFYIRYFYQRVHKQMLVVL